MAKLGTGESWKQQLRYTYPTALLRRLDTRRGASFWFPPSSALWSFAPPSFATNAALQVRHSSASISSSSSAATPTPPIPKPPRKPRKPLPKPATTKKPIKDLPTRLRSADGSTSLPALPEFQDLTRGARGLVRRSRAGAGGAKAVAGGTIGAGGSQTPIMTDGGRKAPRAATAAAAAASRAISEPSSSSPSPALQQSPISQPSTSSAAIKISEPEPSASHSHSQSHSQSEPEPEPEPEPESEAEAKAYARAVARGEFPSTPLAKEIFMNMRAYEGDVLLTRVGMFYESYFTQAEQVASLLGIRLTSKAFGGAATTPSRKSSGTPTPPAKHFPFAGFPIHQKDKYFQLLLDQGRSFVVVEEEATGYSDQRETSDDAPRVSKEQKVRYVARRYTAGTLCNESWQVDGGDNRYLLGISFGGNDSPLGQEEAELGLAYIDISTDRAVATRLITLDELEHELTRVSPVEIVLERSIEALMNSHSLKEDGKGKAVTLLKALLKGSDIALSYVHPRQIDDPVSPLSVLEASATRLVNTHLSACLMDGMPQLLAPHHREARTTMQIDASTLLGLEVRHSLRSNAHSNNRVPPTMWSSPVSLSGTLLSVIKRTLTSSGTRLLVNTLTQPSAHLPTITHRHALVHAFVERSRLREDLRDFLRAQSARGRIGAGTGSHGEIVRIVQKFSAARRRSPSGPERVAKHYGGPTAAMGNARDLMDLREKIQGIRWIVARIREQVDRETSKRETDRTERLRTLVAQHVDLSSLVELIDGAVQRSAIEAADETEDELANPGKTRGVWWLRPDYNNALQALLGQAQDLETQRLAMEADLQTEFNTPLLELKTSPFAPGLFVYVPIKKGNAGLVEQDDRLIPLRTNKTAKTYLFGPWTVLGLQIQEIHDKIATAQEEAFDDLREQILTRQNELLINAGLLDEIDLTLGFAQAADELRWVRPEMQEEPVLDIVNGRHPTVEYSLMTSSSSPRPFIPNDLHIHSSAPVHIITGPNMGGKSTMLRQTAILSILAQSGSFVPADTARIGVVDAVFSRVGARDDLYRDMSTFMLEMHETAYILTHATRKSLVIMDEIGRGTTYKSGLAIAYATLDHILRHIGCRTLFATHYHEVCDMLSEEQGFARPGQKVESSDVSNSSVSADAAAGQRSRDVEFWYTDLDESDGRFSYSYRLKRGINRESHAIKTAQQARMPRSFLETVAEKLRALGGRGGQGDI